MIKVNLHQRKSAVGVVGSEQAMTGLKDFGGLLERLKSGAGLGSLGSGDSQMRGVVVLGVVYAVLLGIGWWYAGSEKTRRVDEVTAQLSSLDNKLSLLNSELSKTQGYKVTKANLEADEKKIRTKIETIQELIRDRTTPPKILMSLSEATPKDVWLRDFSLKDRAFRLSGNANSMDVVSDFIKSLSETIYFKDVTLKGSKSGESGVKGGREITFFELEAQRR